MIFLLISESNIASAQRSECQILDTLDFRYGDMFALLWATEYIICFFPSNYKIHVQYSKSRLLAVV